MRMDDRCLRLVQGMGWVDEAGMRSGVWRALGAPVGEGVFGRVLETGMTLVFYICLCVSCACLCGDGCLAWVDMC